MTLNCLHGDFQILVGGTALAGFPGAANGFMDLATMASGGRLYFSLDPGTGPIRYTAATQPAIDSSSVTIDFALGSIAKTARIVLRKSPAGSPIIVATPTLSLTHEIDYTQIAGLMGIFTLRFWNGYDVIRDRAWRAAG